MFHRRPQWAQLIRSGVPALFVLRPLARGFTPPAIGNEYPVPDPADKFQMARARQMYEQRRIGTWPELELALARSGQRPVPSPLDKEELPGKTRKEKVHARS